MNVLGVVFWTAVRCAAVAAAREVTHAVNTARTIKVTLTARTGPGQMGVSVDVDTGQPDMIIETASLEDLQA